MLFQPAVDPGTWRVAEPAQRPEADEAVFQGTPPCHAGAFAKRPSVLTAGDIPRIPRLLPLVKVLTRVSGKLGTWAPRARSVLSMREVPSGFQYAFKAARVLVQLRPKQF